MTAFAQTITNSLNLFGGSPSSLWLASNWNAFKWGQGTVTMIWNLDHIIANTLTVDSAIFSKDTIKVLSNSLIFSSEMTYESLQDSGGYFYVYVPNTTNAENRSASTYASGSSGTNTWTSGITTTPTWS